MVKLLRRIAVGFAAVLLLSGLATLLFSSTGGFDQSLMAPDLSPSSSSPGDLLNLGLVTMTVSGGTLTLIPDSFTNPFSIASLFIATGTVAAERSERLRDRRLKERLLDEIVQNPGIHLRELHRVLGCAMGALQYHITRLEQESSIMSITNGNSRHFFLSGFSDDHQVLKLAAMARNPTVSSILAESIANGQITQAELSRTLSIEKSLVSYYVTNLVRQGVFETVRVFGRERPVVLTDWARTAISNLGLLVI